MIADIPFSLVLDSSWVISYNFDSAGGIVLAGHGGRIKINNTLDERLRLLEDRVSEECKV